MARPPSLRRRMLCLALLLLTDAAAFQAGPRPPRRPRVVSRGVPVAAAVEAPVEARREAVAPAPPAGASGSELPPVLQSIVNERQEYHLKLGKAMDTLRNDMQSILTKRPDFTIYDRNIILVDPSGVQLRGINQYKSALTFLTSFLTFWFHPSVQFRLAYDHGRDAVRVAWHAVLAPKILLGRPIHVDGVSYYRLDARTGLIVEHKVEKLVVNSLPMQPPYGILSLLQQDAFQMQPVGAGAMISSLPLRPRDGPRRYAPSSR